jgi:membrane protease YdiL (CAAX protease family)
VLLPYQPRKPVPWHSAHLVALAAMYIALQVLMVIVLQGGLEPPAAETPAADEQTVSNEHVVVQALAQGDKSLLLLCAVAVVIVAPVVEELLFRVLLQGWLEACEPRWRWRLRRFFRLPRGLMSILFSSLLFAAVHFRLAKPELEFERLFVLLAANLLANLLTLLAAVLLLRLTARATAADLGWQPRFFWIDMQLGMTAFVVATPMIYVLQQLLQVYVLPNSVAADPVPLFFLAVVLGTLYHRSHRIVPSVAAHAALNAASLTLAWMAMQK